MEMNITSCRANMESASTSLSDSIREIEKCPWYWGAISSRDAENLLADKPCGTFLIRDSGSSNYIFALSHKTTTKAYHSRIPRHNGYYCLGGPSAMIRSTSLVELVKQIIECSKDKDRRKILMHPSQNNPLAESVSLLEPLDRMQMLPSLKYLCRLVVRQNINDFRQIQNLPLPHGIKKYLLSKKYLLVHYAQWEEAKNQREIKKPKPKYK